MQTTGFFFRVNNTRLITSALIRGEQQTKQLVPMSSAGEEEADTNIYLNSGRKCFIVSDKALLPHQHPSPFSEANYVISPCLCQLHFVLRIRPWRKTISSLSDLLLTQADSTEFYDLHDTSGVPKRRGNLFFHELPPDIDSLLFFV